MVKYINSAQKNLEEWLTNKVFEKYVPQLEYLINSEKWEFLLDSFYLIFTKFCTRQNNHLYGMGFQMLMSKVTNLKNGQ